MDTPPVDNDAAWLRYRDAWDLQNGIVYLNHGSFGLPPKVVQQARRAWMHRLEANPVDFFFRAWEPLLLETRIALASLVGTTPENLICVENATYGMNIVANSIPLQPGDEVLLTDHEYGAVSRIWEQICQQKRIPAPVITTLPLPVANTSDVIDVMESAITARTRLIVLSHITSPTAMTLPVSEICQLAEQHGIMTCIDGPHAVAQVPLELDKLGCDFYTASCHKWLSASFGSGFLFVHPRQQHLVQPVVTSWGSLLEKERQQWFDEFHWLGTRDPTPFLTILPAIAFLESVGWEAFRSRTRYLAEQARKRISEVTGREPLTPDDGAWYTSMGHIPLGPHCPDNLQDRLWKECSIEVPIIRFGGQQFVRVSCHLYTTCAEIDLLVNALAKRLSR